MSDSVRPHRREPTRLPCPWDSPGKNTGVGCHFLLQCMKVKSESEGAQLCPTLSDPMDCSPSGSSVHGIFQARVLEWGAIGLKLLLFFHMLKKGSIPLVGFSLQLSWDDSRTMPPPAPGGGCGGRGRALCSHCAPRLSPPRGPRRGW